MEDLLKWDSLYIGDIDARYMPLFVHIREISLSNFYSRIIINANKTINLQNISSASTATATEATLSSQVTQTTSPTTELQQKQVQERKIRIDKITLQGGTVNFTDESIKPRFSANLIEIGGHISGPASDADKLGEIELRGKYDRYAPLESRARSTRSEMTFIWNSRQTSRTWTLLRSVPMQAAMPATIFKRGNFLSNWNT